MLLELIQDFRFYFNIYTSDYNNEKIMVFIFSLFLCVAPTEQN